MNVHTDGLLLDLRTTNPPGPFSPLGKKGRGSAHTKSKGKEVARIKPTAKFFKIENKNTTFIVF